MVGPFGRQGLAAKLRQPQGSNDLNTLYNGIFTYLVGNPCSKWKVVGECKRKRAQVEPVCWMGEKKSLPNGMLLATLLVESIPISPIC